MSARGHDRVSGPEGLAAADVERNAERFLMGEFREAVRQDLSNARKRESEATGYDGRGSFPRLISDLEVGRMAGENSTVVTDQIIEEEELTSDRHAAVD